MFKDYYLLLGISPFASQQEIKKAYRNKSLRWHPDRNPGVDVTEMMQDINEAYRILNDEASRIRYNNEYKRFSQKREQNNPKQDEVKHECWKYDYDVNDEDLRNDINEARKYSKDLVEEFFKDLKSTTKVAVKGAFEGAYAYIICGILVTIIFFFIRACH